MKTRHEIQIIVRDKMCRFSVIQSNFSIRSKLPGIHRKDLNKDYDNPKQQPNQVLSANQTQSIYWP